MIIQGLFELPYQEGRAYYNSCLNTPRHLHVILHNLDLAKMPWIKRIESFEKSINLYIIQGTLTFILYLVHLNEAL